MSDTALTSFLGSCLDLLQALMEVRDVHSQLPEMVNILKITGERTTERLKRVNENVLTSAVSY